MVCMEPGLVEQAIVTTPSSFTVHARNPERNIEVGGNAINFTPVGGPAFVSDLDRGRRAGTCAEPCAFVKFEQMFDIIHLLGAGAFASLDLPADSRHLDHGLAGYLYGDKAMPVSLLGRDRARDGMELAKIALGLDEEDLKTKPCIVGNINTNSPRQLDGSMAQGLIELARANQPVVVTPFTLCGAMAPATVAGALVQQNAEALFGLVLIEIVNPGAPGIYGGFTSNVDMKTGAPAFGTPECPCLPGHRPAHKTLPGAPYRSSNTNASNAPDAQAAYESMISLWGAANFVFHGAGWLEGVRVDDDSLGFEAIEEVLPGGHCFGAQHTLARYENAFYSPIVSDWRNFENRADTDSVETARRANAVWKRMLREYQAPPIDPGIVDGLNDCIARRKGRDIRLGRVSARHVSQNLTGLPHGVSAMSPSRMAT